MLTSLPKDIIAKIAIHLDVEDIFELGSSHKILSRNVFWQPSIWTKHVLFPMNRASITDEFIKKNIYKITRHYGILEIQMICLPLTWFGYFLIFDQFGHSLTSISIQSDQLYKLVYHLTKFATHLATLQENNKIPCTFREYAFEANSQQSTPFKLNPLPEEVFRMKLDDPPFERLNHIEIASQTTQDDLVPQLQTLLSFLSGFNICTKRFRMN